MNAPENPGAAALLEIARSTLLADVLPGLSGDARLKVQMVANAMAISQRALADPADIANAVEALEAMTGSLAELRTQIRAGKHDPRTATHAAVHKLLTELAEARCRVSAPKALASPTPASRA